MNIDLPYDIIYKIYFYTNDYCTANNFWLLCKTFNKSHMTNYKMSYKHKFTILYNNLFHFLSFLPDIDYNKDIDLFELVTTQCLTHSDKTMLKNDIRFMYKLYKSFFIYYLTSEFSSLYFFQASGSLSSLSIIDLDCLSNILMIQGSNFIDRITDIQFNKNKITISAKYKDRNSSLKYLMSYYRGRRFSTLNHQIGILENQLIH